MAWLTSLKESVRITNKGWTWYIKNNVTVPILHFYDVKEIKLLENRILRSSRPKVFCKKNVLKNFSKFTGKHLHQRLFFNKVADLKLSHRYFPVNFKKFLRTSYFIKHLRWLLLHLSIAIATASSQIKSNNLNMYATAKTVPVCDFSMPCVFTRSKWNTPCVHNIHIFKWM